MQNHIEHMTTERTYPYSPGFQRLSDTSREAAESVKDSARTKRGKILAEMQRVPLCGMTIDEAAVLLKCQTGTASARMRELELHGDIQKTTQRRRTRAGKTAVVYFLVGAWK